MEPTPCCTLLRRYEAGGMKLGYMRLSSEGQADGDTLENHRVRLEAVPCDLIFCDLQSGWKNSESREQFQALVATAKELRSNGEAVDIYFGRVDRWGRDSALNVLKVEELEAIGCKLYSLETGEVSTATPGQWLSLSQQSMFAEYYSRQLSYNITQGVNQRRLLNKPLASSTPLGLKLSKDKSSYEFDDRPFKKSKATGYQVARELIEKFISGAAVREITRYLNEKYGCKRNPSSITKWLKNPSLRGHIWYYDPPKNKAKELGIAYKDLKIVIIRNQHPAIITPDEWATMGPILEDNKRLRGQNKGKTYPLQFLCKCSLCGWGLSRNRGGKSKTYNMRCYNIACKATSMACSKVEAQVIEHIQNYIEEIQGAYGQPSDAQSVKSHELLELERQRQDIEKMYAENPMEGLKIALNTLDKQIEELTPIEIVPEVDEAELQMLANAISNPDAWDAIGEDARRLIYQSVLRAVVIDLKGKRVVDVQMKF